MGKDAFGAAARFEGQVALQEAHEGGFCPIRELL
jgi:hypothetical protein